MSLAISRNGFSTYGIISTLSSHLSPSGRAANAQVATTGSGEKTQDTVELSSESRLLQAELMLPTEENVKKMSSKLSKDLGDLLVTKGISPQPPIEFATGPSGEIIVKGDRPDKEQILAAVNGDKKVAEEIRTVSALASAVADMAESLEFQREYMASNDPESVVRKYWYLFNGQNRSHQIGVVYDGTGVSVMSDGQQLSSSQA